ncbi:MAG TPA: BTAD domain-containing putative transcriptional regulator [Pseudonocardiaceae bacterium]|nr:BTAD domain-containing putative transcriptional regulator [Pseudonocardiaceae bacterium]
MQIKGGGVVIDIRLLGPLQVFRDRSDVTPSARKQRQVFTLLALNTNSLVGVDQLFDELWENRPPASALTTLQTYIYQLRRHMRLVNDQGATTYSGQRPAAMPPMLLTRGTGYELRLNAGHSVDVRHFDRLATQGQAELKSGKLEQGVSSLRQALSLWRGTPLIDVGTGQRLSLWVTRLNERHKATQELWLAAELELGHHHAVLDDLVGIQGTHPLHEGFASHLMVALHRCGRRSDALDVFRTIRKQLVDELGLEPSAQLQRLHRAVLSDDPELSRRNRQAPQAAASRRVPAQLPPDVPFFVGRKAELAMLESYLGSERSRPTAGTRLVELHGPPGVGKTALATHAAHRVRQYFPDGQLFVELSGMDKDATQMIARMTAVLQSCLRSCGLSSDELPDRLDELVRLFRTWCADRRVLVVVDNVFSAVQLRALMPGGSGCALIATHRYRTHGWICGQDINLSPLSATEGLQLFSSIAGEARARDEPDAVVKLLEMSEQLPLAVRAIADRLRSRPMRPTTRLVTRLQHDKLALLELPAGGHGLLDTIGVSFRNLPREHRDALRSIVNHRQPCSVADISRCLAANPAKAESLLEHLVDAHFLEEGGGEQVLPPRHRENVAAYRMSTLTWHAVRFLLDTNQIGIRPENPHPIARRQLTPSRELVTSGIRLA